MRSPPRTQQGGQLRRSATFRTPLGSAMSTQPSSARDPGKGLIVALAERDFPRLAGMLTRDVRMRALIPPGLVELSGAEAVAEKFSSWFGDAEVFELIRSGSDRVADRLHVFYRLHVKKTGDVPEVVEQHVLCALDGERINALDLVCSGFRPLKHATVAAARRNQSASR